MKTPSETLATLRQPLGALLLLVGGGATLAALAVWLLPHAPTDLQRSATDLIGWVPGVYRGLEMTRDEPQGFGSVRLEHGERRVARFPVSEQGWSAGGIELEGWGLAAVLAAWGAALGLLFHLLWFVTPSRQVIGLSILLGVGSGLLVAHSLPMAPRYWASFWLRGVGGLPGLEEIQGSPVGVENQPSSVTLVSLGGPLAEYPPSAPPWTSSDRVVMHGRGRAWFASYGVVAWLGAFLVAAALRASRWRHRVVVGALGLGLACWIVLPFLPDAIGHGALSEIAGHEVRGAGFSVELPGSLPFLRGTRLGFGVGLGLLLLLVGAWLLVLTPIGLLGGTLSALGRRSAGRAAAARADEDRTPPESIPVTGDGEPAWLSDYEDRRSGDGAPPEPHPAPQDKEP